MCQTDGGRQQFLPGMIHASQHLLWLLPMEMMVRGSRWQLLFFRLYFLLFSQRWWHAQSAISHHIEQLLRRTKTVLFAIICHCVSTFFRPPFRCLLRLCSSNPQSWFEIVAWKPRLFSHLTRPVILKHWDGFIGDDVGIAVAHLSVRQPDFNALLFSGPKILKISAPGLGWVSDWVAHQTLVMFAGDKLWWWVLLPLLVLSLLLWKNEETTFYDWHRLAASYSQSAPLSAHSTWPHSSTLPPIFSLPFFPKSSSTLATPTAKYPLLWGEKTS